MAEAAGALGKFFGLNAIGETDKVGESASMHQMMLSGELPGKGDILAVAKIKMDSKYGCVLNLQVKTLDEDVCQLIMESLS